MLNLKFFFFLYNVYRSSAQEPAEASTIMLSADGFWLLLRAVEVEIDETDSLEGIYASLPCTKAIRDQIVRYSLTLQVPNLQFCTI